MSDLLIRARALDGPGVITEVTPERASWDYLSMQVRRLNTGMTWSTDTGDYEYVHVVLGGLCRVTTNRGNFDRVGRRPNVFSGMPHAVYVPRHTLFTIEALTDGFEVASCWVPCERDYPLHHVTPAESAIELRGGGNASRQINSIVPPGFPAQRIIAVEVYTPPGNWSSYPPHKHDIHREDSAGRVIEADLEEIYYYKIDRPEGYAYQRVYTDDGSLDTLLQARDNDTVLVPEGYHPVVSAHGYTTYYLNFLAGSAHSLANSDDPAYAWVKAGWATAGIDPRLPLVQHDMEK